MERALDATGNAALIQLATTSAFTREQLKIMENMSASDNAEMKEAVEKIQSRLSNAVAEGIETARKTVVPPLEKATGEIANGMIVSFLNAVSDIPGVGFVLSALGLIDTAVKAASSAGQIVEKAQEAAEPVTDAIAEVQQTVGKLASEATESVNEAPQSVAPRSVPLNHNREIYGPHQNDYPKGDEGYAAFEEARKAFQEDKQKKRDADIAALAIAKQSALPKIEMKTGRGVDAQVFTHENQGITVGQGGSRKRRRIHKLSRRIERTLRRVQKKYGFKDKGDKGDFLRRTLKHHKHKR